MAFSQADLDALDAAIKIGATTVKYKDGEITYRSLDDLYRIRRQMLRELGVKRKRRSVVPSFSRGT